ncbi:hypothetical protein CDCA_CDCA16G4165 [Cyanidium caldarium]|uniref:ACT domain-containing protein n=1 Tax=Cyanidium caldarium TaxID=2771 RepID=A0AAV9J1E3_CYACA|nr:hypothetical protein CDCA_CDCA16G4165 [Cyanidium caldarium]
MLPTRVSYSDSAGVAWIQTPVGVGGRPVTGRRGGLVLQGRGRGRTALSSRLHLRQSAGFWGTPCFSGTQPAAAVSPSHTPSLWKLQASAAPTVPSDAAMRQGRDRASSVAERSYRGAHYFVHKFGGSSLADASCFHQVTRVLESVAVADQAEVQPAAGSSRPLPCRAIVVVSAVAGVTNALEEALQCAVSRDRDAHYLEKLEQLREQHESLARTLLSSAEARQPFLATLSSAMTDLQDLLRAAYISRSASDAVKDLVLGYGELWSAQLLWALLREQRSGRESQDGSGGNASAATTGSVAWLDARNVIVAHRIPNLPPERKGIDWPASQRLFDEWMGQHASAGTIVVTGFIASDSEQHMPTTLGRNGSDLSASIFARLVHSPACTIWTDVDGVYSADPRAVPDAVVIPRVSFKEAAELAYFGAKVLHPDTLAPVLQTGIPVRIRNTFRPERSGTEIGPSPPKNADAAAATDAADGNSHDGKLAARKAALGITAGVKGFTSVRDISVLNVEGAGMIGVPGIAGRAFSALYEADVSVVLIAQASSEFSICLAVPGRDGDRAAEALRRAFRFELADGIINSIELIPQCSIVAMVGENMQFQPGVSSRLFASLAKAGVNIRAIAQGSSEHNISVVVFASDERQALRAAHAAFYLGDHAISVGILGPGLVGGTLVDQIREQRAKLRDESGVDFRIRAVANRTHMLLLRGAEDGVSDGDLDAQWRELFQARGEPLQMDRFVAHVNDGTLPHAVVADCTASEEIGARYVEWLRAGVNIVTPNKRANTASMEYYHALREAQRARNTHFFYEANVGAGLPIITSVRDLLRTGDAFLTIEGIFSGTLSYIFNEFDGSRPFSEIVQRAKELGYTEPDPREDLAGMDVARKVVILGREVGLRVELSDIAVQSLVPESLSQESGVSIEEFMRRLPEHDEQLGQLASEARQEGKVLRYVGVVDVQAGRCAVELRRYPATHPFGSLQGSDNIVSFRTVRYDAQPLVVRGPGAGAAVTAAGVFADLLRLAAHLGAPSG